MPTISPLQSPRRFATRTDEAMSFMTAKSKVLLPQRLLDLRIGRGSVAGGLNDQVRFRVEGSGPMSQRSLVADTALAATLLASPAGPKLERQLRAALATADPLSSLTDVKGFILPEDTQAVVAATLLADAESGDPDLGRMLSQLKHGRVDAVRKQLSERYETVAGWARSAGAWNADGWITFMPDTARAMLIQAGAYTPSAAEKDLRRAGRWSDYISGNAPHEVQHSVSADLLDKDYPKLKWIEEGTANVFSRTLVIHRRIQEDMGVSRFSYAGHLAHTSKLVTWKPWIRPSSTAKQKQGDDANKARNYQNSQVILRELVKLGGASFNSNAGIAKARELLQGRELRYVPGALADAIIAHQHLDPSKRESLRRTIRDAIELKDPLDTIRRRFGLNS